MGSVHKRGRFYSYYYDEYEVLPDGTRERVQHTIPLKIEDKQTAKIEEHRLNVLEREGGLKFLGKQETWLSFVKDYEDEMRTLLRKPKTISRALSVLATFNSIVKPLRPADAEKPAAIRRFLKRRHDDGRPVGTVRLEVRTLSAAFTKAVEWKLCRSNPFRGLEKKIKTVKKKGLPRFLSYQEHVQTLAAAERAGDDLDLMELVFVYEGHRSAELIHAWEEDVVLDRNIFTVRARPCKGECGEKHYGDIWTPKDYEERDIPLHPLVRARFMKRRSRPGRLFLRFGEVPWTEDAVGNVFRRIFKQAEVKNASPRTFRHTFLTWKGQQGVPVRTLQKWAGHSKVETTMIYCHDDDTHSQEAMKKAAAVDISLTKRAAASLRNRD